MRGLLRIALLLCLSGQALPALAHDSCETNLVPKATDAKGKWDGKFLIFDTNVMLNDPQAIYKYPGAHIIISGTVLEELDSKKNDPRLGKTARSFSRELLKLIEREKSPLNIKLGGGSLLSLDYKDYLSQLTKTTLDRKKKDNELLALAVGYGNEKGMENVILISDDLNVRIKSIGLKIEARPFELELGTTVSPKDSEAVRTFELTDKEMKNFLELGFITKPQGLEIAPNEFVTFSSPATPASLTTVGRFHFNRAEPGNLLIKALPDFKKMGLPFMPLNIEQAMALDVLLDPTIDCVILEAKAGTGKTFLTMMAAMYMREKKAYQRVLVTKPTVYMGHNNPGALPGSIDEKYSEWMKPYLDNISRLMSAGKNGSPNKPVSYSKAESLPFGFELLPFEFMRGRSIPKAMIVVDEFQNTNLHEAKTILTRVGEETKMVIMGDASQIDVSPNFLNATNNGLTVSATLLTDPNLPMDKRSRVARVKLHAGVRSGFADMASDIFDQPVPLD